MSNPSATKYLRYRQVLGTVYHLLPWLLLLVFADFGFSASYAAFTRHAASNYYLALLLYWGAVHCALSVVLTLVALGLYFVERSAGLARQTLWSWLADFSRLRGLNLLSSTAGILLFYWAVRNFPREWFLVSWLAFVLYQAFLTLFLDSLFLPLFFKLTPLEQGELLNRLAALAQRAGLESPRFAVLHVGHKTARSNALVTGIGRSHRILITDTVLETFAPEELEAVVAHEIGHQVKHDSFKRLAILAALYLTLFTLAQWALPDFVDNLEDFAILPYLILVFTVAGVYLRIVFNGFARRQEKAADRFSWQLTGDVPAFISMMRKLAERNPESLRTSSFASHPGVEARIAEAEAFLSQQAGSAVPVASAN